MDGSWCHQPTPRSSLARLLSLCLFSLALAPSLALHSAPFLCVCFVQVDSLVQLLLFPQTAAASTQRRSANLILVTPPATDPLTWALSHSVAGAATTAAGAGALLTRSNSNTAQYAQRVRDIAERRGLPLVDLFALTDVQQRQPDQPNPFLCDGLHLSPAGNLLLYRELVQCINQRLPHLAIDQLPLDAPFHGDITPDNYATLFGAASEQGQQQPEGNV